jgi:hypothetical protein
MDNTTIGTTAGSSQDVITPIITIILILLYFLLAIIFILLVLTHKTFRSNKLNWPTVNVALTTAVFALSHLLITIVSLKQISTIPCRLIGFIVVMTACQMMYAYCVSSFNRLLAIRYFSKLIFRSSKWLLTTMTIGWIIATLLTIPHLLHNTFVCVPAEDPVFFSFYNCVIALFLPISIVTIINICIFRYIRRIGRRIHDQNNNKFNSCISRKRDAHVSKMMLLTFSLFVIGWAPILAQQLFASFEHPLPTNLSKFFQLLLPLSLLGDMIVLLYSNQPIRQLIKEKLHCNQEVLFVIKRS